MLAGMIMTAMVAAIIVCSIFLHSEQNSRPCDQVQRAPEHPTNCFFFIIWAESTAPLR